MNYDEFRFRVNPFVVVPTKDDIVEFLEGPDTLHLHIVMGYVDNEKYVISISSKLMEMFVETLEILSDRGAVVGKDFIVLNYMDTKSGTIKIGIHTHDHTYLSDEDFDSDIKRISTR